MSADNGIYILETQGPEYRVIEASAIENITYGGDETGWNPKEVKRYYQNAEVFTSRSAALEVAADMEQEYETEYGVKFLRFPYKQFPK